MKNFKKFFAGILASMVLVSATSCAGNNTTTVVTDSNGNVIPAESTIDLSNYSIDKVYGSQLYSFLGHQYYFNGQAIPIAESDFYFINAFVDLTRLASYGYYPLSVEGFIDLSADFPNSADVSVVSCGDFFVKYAEKMLYSDCVLRYFAENEGVVLSEESLEEIDRAILEITPEGTALEGISLDQYLQIYYGCNIETFRQIVTNYKLADLYTTHYIENYDFEDVPEVRFVLISAPESAGEAAVEQAEIVANQILERSNNLDDLEVQGALAFTNGSAIESSITGIVPGKNPSALEEWAYDESRSVGDIEVIYAPERGYYVAGYAGLTELPEADREEVAIKDIGDLVTDSELDFYTNDPYERAQPVTGEIDPVTGHLITSKQENLSTAIRVLCTVLGIGIVGGIAYYVFSKKNTESPDEDDKVDKADKSDKSGKKESKK